LTIWEAQFGDFANGAQVIIDQFISSGEDKWKTLTGLVLLLPHGFEGMGPEHSYARLGRFLQLCAEDNMQICDCTTPAQFFHLLRRQVIRPWRKPLVVMTPKSLLRAKACRSPLKELTEGRFQRIIGDQSGTPASEANRVLLCSGRIYYDLVAAREESGRDDVHIIRLEQLYPLHSDELARALRPYGAGTELFWTQDEPWNMGAWYFIKARMQAIFGNNLKIQCISRAESASPATGSGYAHRLENKALMDAAFNF
jgi:2-oxoglutarate dehydrogenase E1 component